MSLALVVATTVVAVLVVLLGVAATLASRRIGLLHVGGTLLLEALLLLQAVLATIAMVGGDLPADTPTFLGYLSGIVLLPVAGLLWARTDSSRWSGTVLAVTGAAVAVMIWRLLDIWEATGA